MAGKYERNTAAGSVRKDAAVRRKWKKWAAVLSVFVVVGTTLALTLPAITMNSPQCGLEAHSHTAQCYESSQGQVLACCFRLHSHTASCYDPAARLVCGEGDTVLHQHDPLCRDGDGQLVCRLAEQKAHSHTDSCYEQTGVVTDPGHSHTEVCYTWEVGTEPMCQSQEPEHIHTEACFGQVQGQLICTEQEREPVTEPGEPVLTCTKEEIVPHTHTEDCYTAQQVAAGDVKDTDIILEDQGATVVIRMLECTRLQILEHRHGEDCLAPAPGQLVCQLTEHTHTDTCRELDPAPTEASATAPGETEPAQEQPAALLEFAAEDYVTTVAAPAEAMLPVDTQISAQPLFDSDVPAVAAFSLLEEEPDTGADTDAYVKEILEAVTWGEVTRIRLFDITLYTDQEEVQPQAPVEVQTQFAQPMAADGASIYGVHFGENGLEILPVRTRRDSSGNITAVTHTQSSFSTTGYILVHLHNEKDIGPNILPVHYCIWVNDQWIIAGSTRTGWYGSYDPQDAWPPQDDQRDHITLEQMRSVLGPYGLDVNDHETLSRTVWYQRAEDDGKTIRHDTTPQLKTVNGEDTWVFLLSGNKVKDDGYHIYYVPAGTVSGKESDPESTYPSNRDLANDLTQESKFYTMTVRDMNNLVYSLEEENDTSVFPQAKVYRYGAPVEMTVRKNIQNGENMGWMWVNDRGNVVHGLNPILNGVPDERFGHTDNGDGTETYTFDGILGRTTLIPYSIAVEGATQTTAKQVDIAVHLDGRWQKAGQLNLMYQKDGVCEDEDGQPRWFITAGQVYTILKNYGFTDSAGANDITQDGYTFCHADTAFEGADLSAVALRADGKTQKIDSTIAIGLGTEGDNFTLFYLPGSSSETREDIQGKTAQEYADSDKIVGDRFYSVTVRDDYQLVYYGYETDNFHVYVPEGGPVEVSVQNALSVLWSVREPWLTDAAYPDYTETVFTATQNGNFNRYSFEALYGPVIIEASSLNPTYTVQYYADIVTYDLYESAGTNTLNIIDTTGKNVPTDSKVVPDFLYLQLDKAADESGSPIMSTENNGDQTQKYQVHQNIVSQAIYTQKEFQYDRSHLWKNIDKLWNNDSYEILRIGILKDGRDPQSQEVDDWWVYNCRNNGANITFTNIASEENAPHKDGQDVLPADQDYTILLTEGMVIRLHYTLVEGDRTINNVGYYDYDITNGVGPTYDSGIEGINARANYPGTNFGNGGSNIRDIYAFGNTNCGTGLASATLGGVSYLNKYNQGNDFGCTFGIVADTLSDGKLQWNADAPDIFGESGGASVGWKNYDGTLTFKKWGDVYVLSAANSGVGSRTGLEYFFHPSPRSGIIYNGTGEYKNILTNNFWVMDNATNRADPNWGKTSTYKNFSSRSDSAAKDTLGGRTHTGSFPRSDDGQNHNSFFGMKFSVDFSISEDYIGPLSYVFFGDDDMWVYLDGQLVCDIGGVHSSVGQYVNLRDYLPVGEAGTAGTHTLTFYYTERGSSGSTCWMSFTLPSVTSSIVEEGTSQIRIQKTLEDMAGQILESSEEYEFTVQLYEDETKQKQLNGTFSLVIQKANGNTEYYSVSTGQSILIGAGDTASILGVPIGTYYVVTEAPDSRFYVKVNGQEDYVAAGEVDASVNFAAFTNIKKSYALPNTGGSGILLYTLGGLGLMSTAVLLYSITRKRRKEEK